MDPLSDIFSLLDVRSARCTRFEAGGEWAIRFPARPLLKFVSVVRGPCWIDVPGCDPCELAVGDTFLLANAPGYVLANKLGGKPVDSETLFDWTQVDEASYGGDDTVLVAGSFVFRAGNARLLLDALPVFVRIPATAASGAPMRNTLSVLLAELGNGTIGNSLVTRCLAEILMVQAMRVCIAEQGPGSMGWIGALSDDRIGGAIRRMHDAPGDPWTVRGLAAAAGMSRSAFALRFRSMVGIAPLAYLLQWRMHCARDALRKEDVSIADLATRLGYASESAFGNAFKRYFGSAPKRFGATLR